MLDTHGISTLCAARSQCRALARLSCKFGVTKLVSSLESWCWSSNPKIWKCGEVLVALGSSCGTASQAKLCSYGWFTLTSLNHRLVADSMFTACSGWTKSVLDRSRALVSVSEWTETHHYTFASQIRRRRCRLATSSMSANARSLELEETRVLVP